MSKDFRRILTVIVLILLLRIGLVSLYEYFARNGGFDMVYALKLILLDPVNLPVTLSFLIITAYYTNKSQRLESHKLWKILLLTAIVICASLIASIIASQKIDCAFFSLKWFSLYSVACLFGALVVVALYLWVYLRDSRTLMTKAIVKNERTQFQYAQLKRQLNPHFLFNSLSILDYLVQEQQTERASDYIKKLANTYRYLLKQEEYATVELSKEVEFINLYIDILRERFVDGFEVNISFTERELGRKIIPCALQILVENAFKHNTVSPKQKLVLDIYGENGSIVARNNINLKTSDPNSTKLGLKNLKEQYRVIANAEIEVKSDKNYFTVKLPIL